VNQLGKHMLVFGEDPATADPAMTAAVAGEVGVGGAGAPTREEEPRLPGQPKT
jgi:hypothetical protein